MSDWTQEALEALDRAAAEAEAEPGSDAARIARLETQVFVLQVGLVKATRAIELLVGSMCKGPP